MPLKKPDLVIFGCGGHSRSVGDVFLSYKPQASLIFVDPCARAGETLYGFAVLPEIDLEKHFYFLGIGNNQKRKEKYAEIGSPHLISIQSPRAVLGRDSHVAQGVFIGNFAHVGPQTSIGINTILNNGCIVEHEVTLGNHCHVAPRAVISGRCKIGDEVFIGVGAVIKDSISICSNVLIGAGALVVKNIAEPGVYIGCPAKKIKNTV